MSLILPVFNEETILLKNLGILYDYLSSLKGLNGFEMLVIDDGSSDRSGELAEEFSTGRKEVRIIHHPVNLNLGNALRTGFNKACGKFTITFDLDLSYAPGHILQILETLRATRADAVIASPYMKGGKITAVPLFRRMMSRWANRFMRLAAQRRFHTFTCMVRGYRTAYISSLSLKTTNFEINPEILYKSMILRARVIEIPAHLDWSDQRLYKKSRSSSINVIGTMLHSLMAAFIFRPYVFYLTIGLVLLIISLYIVAWIFINTLRVLAETQVEPQYFDDRFSMAVGMVFQDRPHAFLIGGIVLIAAIQFISLAFISLQSKRYFEELFHLNSTTVKQLRK